VSELEDITGLCTKLGATPVQAKTMARQLIKRADQISAERGLPREEAINQLLRILVQGRQGTVPEAYKPPAASRNSGSNFRK
jgi:hypothetical protein